MGPKTRCFLEKGTTPQGRVQPTVLTVTCGPYSLRLNPMAAVTRYNNHDLTIPHLRSRCIYNHPSAGGFP